jgi:hypothetical protein
MQGLKMRFSKLLTTALFFVGLNSAYAANTVSDQPVIFGNVDFTSSVGSATIPVNVTFTCTSGVAYSLKPNASSSGNINIALLREGVSNGNAYMYLLNPGGVLMRSGVPASLVTGTCTGAAQSVTLTAVISGSTTVGSLVALNKTGAFSQSTQLLQLTSGATVLSPAQQISGEIIGHCTANATPLSFGNMIQSNSATSYTIGASVSVTCDNNLTYILKPHNNGADFTLSGGMGVDVSSPPRPADPAELKLYIRLNGTQTWAQWGVTSYTKTAVGNGVNQTYDVRGDLFLSANWHGTINKTLMFNVTY